VEHNTRVDLRISFHKAAASLNDAAIIGNKSVQASV
jgi:hypothetical protein